MFRIFLKIKQDRILLISILVLIIVAIIAPLRLSDIDWPTLEALATLMLGVELLNYYQVLTWISERMLMIVKDQRQLIRLMCLIAFLGAMILTNDVAIITLCPIYLQMAQRQHLPVCLPISLITIAANLGSSTMPFGNPQNLFLVNYYHLGFGTLLAKMMPVTFIGLGLILLGAHWITPLPFTRHQANRRSLKQGPILIVSILMVLTFGAIFKLLPLPLMLVLMFVATIKMNHKVLLHIDYGLLLTFMCFFLAVGGLKRLSMINQFLTMMMQGTGMQYGMAIFTSQFISNVPAALLLSHFTTASLPILMGVNVGGLGTLVASLANLLAFKIFMNYRPQLTYRFLGIFSLTNVSLLIVLISIGYGLII